MLLKESKTSQETKGWIKIIFEQKKLCLNKKRGILSEIN